jgi:hypothetical protein
MLVMSRSLRGREEPSIPSEGRDIVLASATPLTGAGRSVIVTIGIDRYRHWRALDNAVGDALGAAALFERLGFAHVVPPLPRRCDGLDRKSVVRTHADLDLASGWQILDAEADEARLRRQDLQSGTGRRTPH